MLKTVFKVPTAHQIAEKELENAKRELLISQSMAEHSAKMVEYYQGLIKRLTKYVQSETEIS